MPRPYQIAVVKIAAPCRVSVHGPYLADRVDEVREQLANIGHKVDNPDGESYADNRTPDTVYTIVPMQPLSNAHWDLRL